jgi:hypothetical protein
MKYEKWRKANRRGTPKFIDVREDKLLVQTTHIQRISYFPLPRVMEERYTLIHRRESSSTTIDLQGLSLSQ